MEQERRGGEREREKKRKKTPTLTSYE